MAQRNTISNMKNMLVYFQIIDNYGCQTHRLNKKI